MILKRNVAWTATLLLAAACNGNTQPLVDDELEMDRLENEPASAVEESGSGARKSLGGVNGQGDFCDDGTCVATEGDCDSNAGCAGDGSVCLSDNGGRYANLTGANANQQDDHCAPAYCNDFTVNSGPGEAGLDCGGPCGLCAPVCELAQHHADRCTYHCACTTGAGDCDSDRACVGWELGDPNLRAVCAADTGNRFGGPAANDYCLPRHCTNRAQDSGLGETGIDVGGVCGTPNCANPAPGAECTPSCPCAINRGDCDTNLDCQPGLTCVENGTVDTCELLGPGGVVTNVFHGGDVGEGLDFQGTFPFAVNVRGPETNLLVGNANFIVDTSHPNLTFFAQNNIPAWHTASFGATANDNNLELVVKSIRWSQAPNNVDYTMSGLIPGETYKLQLLFAENCCNRGFDIYVNNVQIVNDINPGALVGGVNVAATAVAVTHVLTLGPGVTQILIRLDQPAPFPDNNPILNGFSLEQL